MTDSERRNLWAERRRQALLEDREEIMLQIIFWRAVVYIATFVAASLVAIALVNLFLPATRCSS